MNPHDIFFQNVIFYVNLANGTLVPQHCFFQAS